jgi:hypothetical protein
LICDEGVGINGIDREAREFMGSEKAEKSIVASAFFTNSTFNKYIINFFLKISSKITPFPTKIFSNKKLAINWLENFVEKK